MGDVRAALARFEDELATECARAGRQRSEVTLVAVSKSVAIEAVRAAYDHGQRHFGESRYQEAVTKIPYLPNDAVWHFVGRLQSNKARAVAERFDVVHSLTNERQLAEIRKASRSVDCLVQVNIAGEGQKEGIQPQALDKFLEVVAQSKSVRCRGLTVIAPFATDPEQVRWVFREAARMASDFGLPWTSMGMSGDWRVAIQEGATHLRIGTALFGGR